jgi:hypothetical protein
LADVEVGDWRQGDTGELLCRLEKCAPHLFSLAETFAYENKPLVLLPEFINIIVCLTASFLKLADDAF